MILALECLRIILRLHHHHISMLYDYQACFNSIPRLCILINDFCPQVSAFAEDLIRDSSFHHLVCMHAPTVYSSYHIINTMVDLDWTFVSPWLQWFLFIIVYIVVSKNLSYLQSVCLYKLIAIPSDSCTWIRNPSAPLYGMLKLWSFLSFAFTRPFEQIVVICVGDRQSLRVFQTLLQHAMR